MKHLFLRGSYKPLGVSGEAMIESMLLLKPEIYGSIADPEKVEINGLHYIFQRLPIGIEECRYVKLITREGFEHSGFTPIVPSKRRRNCYRIDEEQMFIEMTRGRSDIYDVLTHLTFMYIESEKIRRNALDHKMRPARAWIMLQQIVTNMKEGKPFDREVGCTYLSFLMGRTFEETMSAIKMFDETAHVNSLFSIIYHLGRLSIDEHVEENDREITFSQALKERLGHHEFGEAWAHKIKVELEKQDLLGRPIHIISANTHSVMNVLYAKEALKKMVNEKNLEDLAEKLSQRDNKALRAYVVKHAKKHGMTEVHDESGTNISVQIFDTCLIDQSTLTEEIKPFFDNSDKKVIIVMDYAFGEQAYETMDELLKPYEPTDQPEIPLDVQSVSVMGKAGILEGGKGDIMVATAHIFEGSADNYPVDNHIDTSMLEGHGLSVVTGPMISVLGTSLQNKDILRYFKKSSWGVVGLEMEGAHYQKAIQAASKIRGSIRPDVKVNYAYYASDNPLETGSTLASGSLGLDGVRPTYLITTAILKCVFTC